jgi:hypothetical protein
VAKRKEVLFPHTPGGIALKTTPEAQENWRQAFAQTDDPFRKAQILRAVADSEKVTVKELNDILDRVTGLPEEANIRWAVQHRLSIRPEAIPNEAITEAEELLTRIGEEWIGGRPGVGLTNNQISRAKAGIATIAKKYGIDKNTLWGSVWWEAEIKPEALETPLTEEEIEKLIATVVKET